MNSHMYFDSRNLTWRLQSLRNPDTYLLLHNPTPGTIPLGTNTWLVTTNGAVCGLEEGTYHDLTFSMCYPDKYTCNDGTCIALGWVKYHCNPSL